MKIIRFNEEFNLTITAIYKKGKSGKLSVDNIRLVLQDVGDIFRGEYNTSNVLCSIKHPVLDSTHFLSNCKCGVTGLPMTKCPDFTGDLEVIVEGVSCSDTFKQRGFNYYKQDMNSPEVQQVLKDIITEVECFIP